MQANSTELKETSFQPLPQYFEDEMAQYETMIKKFRAGLIGETKMQKFRLQFGTYANARTACKCNASRFPAAI